MARNFVNLFTVLILLTFSFSPLSAQQGEEDDLAWVQIEAQSSLLGAQESIRTYAAKLADVNGFSLGGGWYGVVLGPYSREDADEVLRVYRSERSIPRDAYVVFSSSFRQQFWPIGANLLDLPRSASVIASEPVVPKPDVQNETTIVSVAPQDLDETPREARQSERLLNRDERKKLQVMLKWGGFYSSSIDGAFGRGTRGSMANWQKFNNFEPTGIMTTKQRAVLLSQYNAVLNGLGLALVRDDAAGIEIKIPLDVVKFEKHEPPFAHYPASGDLKAKVLLISQEGDQNTMFGLYDIMQTLEIVPEDGARSRNKTSFQLIGENAEMISHTEVSLKNGHVKGFTLIWPAGDETRRTRLLAEMQASFKRSNAVLDPAAGENEDQSIDLISGLEIRRPTLSRSGFYVDGAGTVVTTVSAVKNCSRITLENDIEADVVAIDEVHGIAVLRPRTSLVPMSVAVFQRATPRLQSEISVSGFSYEGMLGAPTVTFGVLADLKGLEGEPDVKRLALAALPGDVGGPVFDAGGAVLGMLLPDEETGRKLPQDVRFSANSDAIVDLLNGANLRAKATDTLSQMAPEDLTLSAMDITVLVSCW